MAATIAPRSLPQLIPALYGGRQLRAGECGGRHFHERSWPLAIEINRRLLTGAVVKSDPDARARYLEGDFPEATGELREVAASSEDALDTAVSAVVKWRHLEELRGLERPRDQGLRREGMIWGAGEG